MPSFCAPTCVCVSLEIGLDLNIPILSAGSFGLSCDYKANLTRVLPPARKVSNFFLEFWHYKDDIKPKWTETFLYKKEDNTEDCFWWGSHVGVVGKTFIEDWLVVWFYMQRFKVGYCMCESWNRFRLSDSVDLQWMDTHVLFFCRYINALDADSAYFSSNVSRTVLRSIDDVRKQINSKSRKSNCKFCIVTPQLDSSTHTRATVMYNITPGSEPLYCETIIAQNLSFFILYELRTGNLWVVTHWH